MQGCGDLDLVEDNRLPHGMMTLPGLRRDDSLGTAVSSTVGLEE
jgi:hypothetical protein